MIRTSTLNESALGLTEDQIAFYRKNEYIKIKDVFSTEELDYFGAEITRKVIQLNTTHLPMEERGTYSKAFLQIVNLWTKSDVVKEFVFSRRLARIAAGLMEVDGVRIYHDQALYKEPSGGYTPWHADQYYWPLATAKTITAWIPLQKTPLDMGPLEFSSRSQALQGGRGLGISDNSEREIEEMLAGAGCDHVVEAFDVGEVSFHSGWLYHRAGPNTTKAPRGVMCVIYMDKDMLLKQPDHNQQQRDLDAWCPGAKVGEVIDTALNPVLFQHSS